MPSSQPHAVTFAILLLIHDATSAPVIRKPDLESLAASPPSAAPLDAFVQSATSGLRSELVKNASSDFPPCADKNTQCEGQNFTPCACPAATVCTPLGSTHASTCQPQAGFTPLKLLLSQSRNDSGATVGTHAWMSIPMTFPGRSEPLDLMLDTGSSIVGICHEYFAEVSDESRLWHPQEGLNAAHINFYGMGNNGFAGYLQSGTVQLGEHVRA